ncbi:alpha-L-arabinofuranosidase [Paludibaculum fermentans]|uniref:alpha-L-arabinofuranosidase n=1 Tax=Paludibaculum fermentans TaxID=1473598 RepID=UPI003EBA22F7
MSSHGIDRRAFVRVLPALGSAAAVQAAAAGNLVVDPAPLFDISPWLYMQFMEPLGTTDSSVEAAWDYDKDDWRQDFVEATRDLAPDVIRFGGLYSRHYKWREGVGPADKRPAIRNYFWGGKETNRVGTHEFVDYCRRVGAQPLYCVNFLADGEKRFHTTPEGDRTGDAREAADWVSYANDPGHAERKRNGAAEPLNIRLWQLGNETSYGDMTFSREQSIQHTIEFARAMRQRDPSIQLIGWGDRRKKTDELWAAELLKQAGEHIDMVAIHLMGQSPKRPDTVLKGLRYQKEPERAWEELLELSNNVETRVKELEDVIAASGMKKGIAVTEGHLSLPPHNANPILAEWLTAAYHARSLNIYQRHGATVKIATAADFQGNRWTVNALTLQTPRGLTYPMPVGSIARLFKRHNGKQGVAVSSAPSGLDIAASRTGSRVYLHVANLNYRGSVEVSFAVKGSLIQGGRVIAIAPEDLRQYVGLDQPDAFKPVETKLPAGSAPKWTFPAGSVSVVELELNAA